ncbi:MAG: asparagine synthase (glutamine-hydrolyzing) [Candidatus Latescibacteria bacterium]|nr:asparagine synthase (glutamine-hydrolyzing) [bacterium]MBD3424291.1 asparagine synthase (glutamine-hydrolyzing) [Candidatus Latescibacterota bacterium]
MCGIYGTTKKLEEPLLDRKLTLMRSRGPDYREYRSPGRGVTLGHTRLAIIDLDPRSNQPFDYEGISIVFNGEIYNFREIKKELEGAGYSFRTTSDTEVVCAAYLEYGEECVNRFNGMFAFVIYDPASNILFGARDRLGQKPLYYSLDGGEFEFASQLDAVAEGNGFSVSDRSVTDYLLWGYIPEPGSIYSEIGKVRAGHSFTYHLGERDFREKKYWDLDYRRENVYTGGYAAAADRLEELLKDAVSRRMISDVPLGIFLSGGIDSSLIAALAQSGLNGRVRTFSVKFTEEDFDESAYALRVAEHIGSDHTEILCDYSKGIDIIRNFSSYYHEPFADSSAIPSIILAARTRDFVTVALSGDGGDECFLGYHSHRDVLRKSRILAIPRMVRRAAASLFDLLPSYRHRLIAGGLRLKDINEFHYTYYTGINRSWLRKVPGDYQYSEVLNSNMPLLERVSDFDIKTYLNGDINTKVDRATMASSLESRSPLMDYRVVEFSRSLPTSYKFRGRVQKRILKDVLFRYVPPGMFDRPKSGFSVPVAEWFRNELKEFMLDNIRIENLKEIPNLKPEPVMGFVRDHLERKWNHSSRIFRILVLINWLRNNRK